MTLHALRGEIGDATFFRLLKEWFRIKARGNATIPEFIALAERLSRRDLDAFFDEWLFTPAKPASISALSAAARKSVASSDASRAGARLGPAPRR